MSEHENEAVKAGMRNSAKDAAEMRAAKQKAQEVVIHLTNAGIEDVPSEAPNEASNEQKNLYAVKNLGGGLIGGRLVVFTDENHPDLTGDFFTKDTYFGDLDRVNQVHIYYNHGFDPTIQKKSLGIGTVIKDEVGIWVTAQINAANEYDKAILDLVEAGLLKWSSGTPSHLVERVPVNEKASWIKTWLLAEGSLTPTPAEPKAKAVSIKSTQKEEIMSENTEKNIVEKPVKDVSKYEELEAQYKKLSERFDSVMKALDTDKGQSLGYVTPDGGTKDAGIQNLGDFLYAIRNNDVKRLTNIYGVKLNEGDGASGGYTVPPQYIPQLMRAMTEKSIVRPRADVRQLSGREAYFPMMDYSGSFENGASTSLAGMSMAWVDEAETIEDTDIDFRQMHVITHKMARSIPISNELLRDSVMALESTITSMFGEAIAYFEDYHFLRGSGVGQPLGIYNAPCLIETATAFSDPVTLAQILTMYKRLPEGSKRSAVWVIHPMLQDNIFALNSTSSGSLPIVQDVTQPALYRLLGLPILFSEKLPELTTQGGVLLADFSQYLIADSGSIQIAMSDHQYFASDQVGIRVTKRVDGQPKWNSARSIGKASTASVSPFIKSK